MSKEELPFNLKIPNQVTKDAIHEMEQGGGQSFTSFREMIDDLENDDNA